MMIVMERAERFVARHVQSEPLSHSLDGQMAEL